ncbi:MAG: hypothetical protein ABI723_17030 [Bacteroidia bacterium]
MPKQRGNLRIEGTVYGMTFYRMNNKDYLRSKRNVTREQILNEPKFASARENGNEFALASKSGKLLRDVVKGMFKEAGRSSSAKKVMRVMMNFREADVFSERGKRNIGIAIADIKAKAMLKGFEFNYKSQVSNILFKPYTVDIASGKISINNLIPIRDITFPAGATYLTLRGAYANVNFAEGMSAIEYTDAVNLIIDGTSTKITLMPNGTPAGTGTKLYFLQIDFFQLVNGMQYELNNGSYNALVIAEVT